MTNRLNTAGTGTENRESLRMVEASLMTENTVWRGFTAATLRPVTGETGQGRRERRQMKNVGHEQEVKMLCRH